MDDRLTIEERATNNETRKHIALVAKSLHKVIKELLDRADEHDLSKLEDPEVKAFTNVTDKLAKLTFGSKEYYEQLQEPEFKSALAHHYAKCRHHPEHHANGIDDMNLIDVIEMFCDWYASSQRQHDGNLHLSIEKNAKRFEMSKQLAKIMANTVELFE